MSKAIRILLVDDYEIYRSGLRQVLESEEDTEVIGGYADSEQTFIKRMRITLKNREAT